MRLHKLLLLMAVGILASCSNDDVSSNVPTGDFDNGFFVLNEGGFGEVTFVNDDLSRVEHNIFEGTNGDSHDLGTYAQSMFFDQDRAFIISNGSNKITVVNRYTFEYIATISSDLQVPRYGVVANGKAFITNSNDFASATDDFITVIDLTDLSILTTINVNDQAERLIANDGKLYVSAGYFGSGNKIVVIDAVSHQIITKITVPEAPNSLEVHNGTLYVLSGGFVGDSSLSKINLSNNTVTSAINFPSSMGNAANLDIDDNQIYFTVGANIYKFGIDVTSIIDTPFINTQSSSFYMGYGFAVHEGQIFISEAADDFASDGKVFIYGNDGTFINSITTGLGPNGFHFN